MTAIDTPSFSSGNRRPPTRVAWIVTVAGTILAELIAIGVYAYTEKSFKAFACGLLIAVASGVVGSLVGFIFGIPKTVTPSTTTTRTDTGAVVTSRTEYQGNTNLEQVSDWLTKLLLGAGLVELKEIGPGLVSLGEALDHMNCLGSCARIVGPAIVVGFSVTGFLLTYLWARIYLINELQTGGLEV